MLLLITLIMQYSSPLAIVPKFLWKPIADYLSYDDIIKLATVNTKFVNILDDDTNKDYFLNDRECDIALVACNTNRINFFWKYALKVLQVYNNINDMLANIEASNKVTNDEYIRYKVFIKSGSYGVAWHNYQFNYNKCSIELIGCESTTLILSNHPTFTLPCYCSIRNITFSKSTFNFRNDTGNTELVIANCKFERVGLLYIDPINVLTIINTVFNKIDLWIKPANTLVISDCIFNDAYLAMCHRINDLQKINYTIVHNIFHCSFGTRCIYLGGNYHKSSLVTISNNTITDSSTFLVVDACNMFILFNNNTITNTKSYLDTQWKNNSRSIVFENNIFNNVEKLYNYAEFCMVQLKANNQFINCGIDLIKYVTQQ